MTRLIPLILISLVPEAAFAHGSHWGQLAGHSHALVWAVAIAAAALAALLATKNGKTDDDAEETEESDAEPA